MVSRGRRPPIAKRARGFALILLMALVTLGVLYFLTVQLEAVGLYQREARQQGGGGAAIEQAREALLGYAATYRDNNANEVFGYLPCPDATGDGIADTVLNATECGSSGHASVGLLPYRTLGLPDLRDGDGNCLWYAVSGAFKAALTKPTPVNWDTQGQFKVVDSNGAILIAPDDSQGGAAAVIFSTGVPLAGQSRTASASGPCKVDPSQVAAYLDANYTFAANGTITLNQGPLQDANGTFTNNDRLAWISPKDIFDRVIARKDFGNALNATPPGQINTLNKEIKVVLEKWIQDDLTAGGTPSNSIPSNAVSYSSYVGDLQSGIAQPSTTFDQTYKKYFDNWSNQFRQRVCANLNTPCLAVNSAGPNCRGALMFGGRNPGGPRTISQQASSAATLGSFFESGLGLLNLSTTTFTGNAAYTDSGTDTSRAADVGTCLFPGAFVSFAQDSAGFASGVTYSGATPIAAVNIASQTVSLGDTGGSAGAGCVWYPSAVPSGSTLSLYFRFQIATKGNGFSLVLADGATNKAPTDGSRTQIMCGSTDSAHLGYSGSPSGSIPGIEKPKIGIEFDTLYSASQNDPPGDHMAYLFWGTTSDSDGSDDNTHYLGSGGVSVTNATWVSNSATLTTASPHGFSVGQVVLVSGLTPSGYNGTVTVSAVTATQFSYVLGVNPGASASGGQAKGITTGSAPRNPRIATAIRNAPVSVVASDTFGVITRTTSYSLFGQRASIVTATAHGLSAGDQVVVAGVNPAGYNGTFTVLSSGLSTTRPYRFRYSLSTDPGAYVSGGTANKVKGSEISGLTWAGATASAASPVSHNLQDADNITTYGMTPSGFGATANLTLIDSKHFNYPLAGNPGGSFAAEMPAGMALVKTGDTHLPYSSFPTSTNIYVRLDITRAYDNANHIAVLDLKAYVGDSFPLGDACGTAEFQNLARDIAALCPSRTVTLQQDSIPINALAALSNAVWSSGSNRVTVTTSAAHGLVSGASVTISGATPMTYNGTFSIIVTGANTFTYAAPTDPGLYVSGGDVEPLSTLFLGFTNARGSSNSGENQNITIHDLLLRSQ